MATYLYNAVTTLVLGEEEDDPSCLKDPVTMSLYELPSKGLGVQQNFTPWELRDAFRTNAINLLGTAYFNRPDKAVLPYKYSLIAYHLCAKTLKVKKAQDLKRLLDDEPHYFSGKASDVLQILRPVHCDGVHINQHVRACGCLHVIYDDFVLCQEPGEAVPHQQYVCKVSYLGRVHFVRRRYTEFKRLHELCARELLMVPGFPQADALFKVGLGDYAARGRALCRYATRVHAALAARGMFSPRLLAFLEVDAARVHIEEDGRVSKLLDTTAQAGGSVWHMVDEFWLKRWRKFVLGRAARRYEPPGPITNERLLVPLPCFKDQLALAPHGEVRATTVPVPVRRTARETFKPASAALTKYGDPQKDDDDDEERGPEPQACGTHYRAVTYDLWVYWKMVHGGGPCISRKTKDLMSPPACGPGIEAVSRLQRFGRCCVAKQQRIDKFWAHLSRTAPGVREVLAEVEENRIKARVDDVIGKAKGQRTASRLALATRYTQRMWRSKKAYAFNDDNVRVMKHAQEIFALADGEVEHASAGAPFVVEEGEKIVQLGGVEQHEVKFSEHDGPSLPVVLKKHSCSEKTFLHSLDRRAKPQVLQRFAHLQPDSVLVSVQGYPASSLTHDELMHRLRAAKWPLVLRFSRPLTHGDVTPLQRVAALDEAGELPDDLKLQMLKRLLAMGLPVRKHSALGRPHDTVLYLDETMLFWQIKGAAKARADSKVVRRKKNDDQEEAAGLSLKYDLSKGVGLYSLKYVRVGKVSKTLKRGASSKANPDHCFSLFCDGGKTLDFECVDATCDKAAARTLFAWTFDKIVAEARGTKIFVDKSGAPVSRKAPKKRLRMILGAR